MEIFRHKLYMIILGFVTIMLAFIYAGEISSADFTNDFENEDLEVTLQNATGEDLAILSSETSSSVPTEATVSSTGFSSALSFSSDTSSSSTEAILVEEARKKLRTSVTPTTDDDDDGIQIGRSDVVEKDQYFTETVSFRKCCAKNEYFNPRLKCKKTEIDEDFLKTISNDQLGNIYPWFPSHILVNHISMETVQPDVLNITRIKPRYKSQPFCDDSECIILQWNRDETALFFITIANGSMMEMDKRNMQTVAVWPVDAYCLDVVVSSYSYYVALLCPCMHFTCVRKCCPRGFYYNVSSNICTQFEGPDKAANVYKPNFFERKAHISKYVGHYILRKMPPCAGRRIEMLNSHRAKQKDPLYIQEDGSLHVSAYEWNIINNSRYCADIFIDNFGRRSTNALYCMRDALKYEQQLVYKRPTLQRRPRGEGGLLTINFVLFLNAVVFTVLWE